MRLFRSSWKLVIQVPLVMAKSLLCQLRKPYGSEQEKQEEKLFYRGGENMVKKSISIVVFLLLIMTVVPVHAAAPTAETLETSINLVWVMFAATLVFFMHAGFTLVESGFTRAKNALHIIMKNFLTISIASILFFVVGFGLMFGKSLGSLIGSDGFFLNGRSDIDFFVFQAVFAATCATIISGAVAERIKISSYIWITVAMTAFIYPVVGHWIWADGWLAGMGFSDFAGST